MVVKKSEYQKQFSPTILTKHIPIYEANLECRNRRRDQQYSHTSIAWDDSDTTSEEELKRTQEKLKELKIKNDEQCQVPECPESHHKEIKPKSEDVKEFSNDQNYLDKVKKLVVEDIEKLDFGKTKVLEWGKKRRMRRPDRKQKIPRARPFSAPAPRKQPTVEHPKPFLSYGHGDGEKTTGILWTHNVRAGTNVYASAMRAKQLRQEEAKKREEKHSKYVWLNDRKKKAIIQLMKKETEDWETEYQKHYPAYDKVIYERALSARPDSRREY
ncbi:centriole, cilia and spindle-associated protein [Patella vulgata]|uniref:centriole, cilia and spindle-associated protein n=1 Tax=Patella vulgata TaxID=6465 RepID=UPI00217F2A9F|nr:centriole, cilia and spindle-associated protein [Patella vulgata]XP_050406239.1 centriole, cilia and spindle-associated protein [Patella vulgata]